MWHFDPNKPADTRPTPFAKAEQGTFRVLRLLRRNSERVSKPMTTEAARRLDLALHLYSIRRERVRLFDAELFGEAAWDVLLILYCAEAKQVRLTVSNVCDTSGVPNTTALRWIGTLEQRDLIVRTPHPSDGRISRLRLSDLGVLRMNELLDRSLAMNPSEAQLPRAAAAA